jgi:hypothetical protein
MTNETIPDGGACPRCRIYREERERAIRQRGMLLVIVVLLVLRVFGGLITFHVPHHIQHPPMVPVLDAESSPDGRHMMTAHEAATATVDAIHQRRPSEFDPYNELDEILMRVKEAASTGISFIDYDYHVNDCSFVNDVEWCTPAWKRQMWKLYKGQLNDLGFQAYARLSSDQSFYMVQIAWQQ